MQYTGQIVEGLMHGRGRLTYDENHYYDGDWVKGKRHGRGIYLNNDTKYEGTFDNDRINGVGTCWYPNGNRFEGQFLAGK